MSFQRANTIIEKSVLIAKKLINIANETISSEEIEKLKETIKKEEIKLEERKNGSLK